MAYNFKKLDLTDRLYFALKTLQFPPNFTFGQNLNADGDSIALYANPGGTVIRSYYDGIKDKSLPYEVRGKAKDPEIMEYLTYEIAQFLESLADSGLPSQNDSFELCDLVISDEPYFTDADDEGNFYFILSFNVTVTVYPK